MADDRPVRGRVAGAVVLLGALCCGPAKPSTTESSPAFEANTGATRKDDGRQPAAADRDKESEPKFASEEEYQRGLGELLHLAPSPQYARLISSVYAAGYNAGKQEASEHILQLFDKAAYIGCLSVTTALLATQPGMASAGSDALKLRCAELVHAKYVRSEYRGQRFAASRYRLSKQIAQHSDVHIMAQGLVDTHAIGYCYGFMRIHNRWDAEKGLGGNVAMGCRHALDAEEAPRPLSAADVTGANDACRKAIAKADQLARKKYSLDCGAEQEPE